jgi:hypothetical protein
LPRRLVARAAILIGFALVASGAAVPTARADEKDDAIRKLEAQLRQATDQIEALVKQQKLARDENARLRAGAEDLLKDLAVAKNEAAQQAAAAAERLVAEKKRSDDLAARTEVDRKQLLQVLEKDRALLLAAREALEKERQLALAARDEARVQAAVAEKNALEARDVAAKQATALKDRLALAAAEHQLLLERTAQLQKRVAELEKDNARLEKGLPAKDPDAPKNPGRNPPPANVEGAVKSTDSSGLMVITIGSDAGLKKGHTLELFRVASQPQYLGMIVIVEVTEKQSVARPVGKLTAAPMPGDNVASKIFDK